MNYWLIKSEGGCYSIDDLKKDKQVAWEGVRNFQARNFMRDGMRVGDLALFYHSSGTITNPTGVYGIAKVVKNAHIDETQFNKKDQHYDAKSIKGNEAKSPWMCVDFSFVKKFADVVTLADIKIDPKLSGIMVAERGSRLSIQPVSEKHFNYITKILAK